MYCCAKICLINVNVQELLKEKEQYGRKTQQEVESLTFRNQQLSKRVMVLQDDMEMVQNQKKKHKVCYLLYYVDKIYANGVFDVCVYIYIYDTK